MQDVSAHLLVLGISSMVSLLLLVISAFLFSFDYTFYYHSHYIP